MYVFQRKEPRMLCYSHGTPTMSACSKVFGRTFLELSFMETFYQIFAGGVVKYQNKQIEVLEW